MLCNGYAVTVWPVLCDACCVLRGGKHYSKEELVQFEAQRPDRALKRAMAVGLSVS